MQYTVSLLTVRDSSINTIAARKAEAALTAALPETRIDLYGIFLPLFGLASDQVYAVTTAEEPHDLIETLDPSMTVDLTTRLEPTVRPTEHSRRRKEGIYVFRWFNVYTRDVEEIVRLSSEAWLSFEGGFDTEVQGLFKEPDATADTSQMLLITWYQDLATWQASRQPSEEARKNFLARAELTIRALPICTRLFKP